MTYVPIKFPGFRYGPGGQSGIFQCAADVPEGWTDNPNDFIGQSEAAEPTRETMIEELTKRGVKVDKRWSDAKLKGLL